MGAPSRIRTRTLATLSSGKSSDSDEITHNVSGIMCREVPIDVDNLGIIRILEATADSQDELVEAACATEEELEGISNANANTDESKLQLKSGDPYGAVLWPAASAVSNYLQTNLISLEKLTILELGTGTGLCAMAAALGGASRVIATDYEEIPLRLLEYAASEVNNQGDLIANVDDAGARLSHIETSLFDICDHDIPLPKCDIVIAADIMYEPKTGIAMAQRTVEALNAGSRVIIGCSPGRPGRPKFQEALEKLLPGRDTKFIEVAGKTCMGPRNDLICGKGSTSVSSTPKSLSVKLLDLRPI